MTGVRGTQICKRALPLRHRLRSLLPDLDEIISALKVMPASFHVGADVKRSLHARLQINT
jgi:hypothetical protein